MLDSIRDFFNSESFMPHGHCFLYQPDILWLHVISDSLILLAYYSIPVALVYFASRRPDMPYRHLFLLFGLFIFLCGTTHVFEIWVLWYPDYGPEGLVKALTALASISTAFVIWSLMPQLLSLPSPSQLQRMNDDLQITYRQVEQRVNERTAELAEANQKLSAAYQTAEKANQAKTDFLANMSHEIRTPMHVVLGLAGVLSRSDPLSPKQKEYVGTLKLSAESLLELITDLLDISKIESEAIVLDRIEFNLQHLMREIVTMLSVKAKEKNISLSLEFDNALEENFIGDPNRLRQVLINLIGNAIKFTEKGGVQVQMKAEPDTTAGHKNIRIRVIDSGIGIPEYKQSMVFEKFTQADSSVNRKYGGTGLGLTIAKSLIELMGGSISLESSLGQGSVFTVHLPLSPAEM